MSTLLQQAWWVLLIRGIAAIFFGTLAILWPSITLQVLIVLFGAYSVVDGFFAVIASLTNRQHDGWWLLLLLGLMGIAAGIFTFLQPGITAVALVYVIATWAVLTGILSVGAAIRLRREIEGEWLLGLGGVVSVLFGLYAFVAPGAGALAILWLIAGYVFVFGLLLLVLAFQARGWRNQLEQSGAAPMA